MRFVQATGAMNTQEGMGQTGLMVLTAVAQTNTQTSTQGTHPGLQGPEHADEDCPGVEA